MSDDPNQPGAPVPPTPPEPGPPPGTPAFTPAVPAMTPGAPLGGDPTGATPGDPTAPAPADGGPAVPDGPADGSPADGGRDDGRDRPQPDRSSLVGAAGGLLAALGLVALLSEPDIADERGLVILVSAIFEALGIALVVLNRARRAAAGGVALSLLAALPLANALVTDPTDPLSAFGDVSSYRTQQLGILALLTVAWLALHLVGPGRRFGAYLGGALLTLWSIPMTWFSLSAVDDVFSAFGGFDPFGSSVFGDPFATGFDDLSATGDDLALKLGLTSLLFGCAYLATAGWLDGRGEARRATPLFAVAPYVLITALVYLQEDLDVVGTAILGLGLGAASIWLGARAGRRFTSWIGVAAVVGAVVTLIGDLFEDSAVGAGIALTLIGVAAVVGVGLLEGRARA